MTNTRIRNSRDARAKVASAVVATALIGASSSVFATDDTAALRKQLEEQRALIQEQSLRLQSQQLMLEEQSRTLDKLIGRLGKIETVQGSAATSAVASAPMSAPPQAAAPADRDARDTVGDLNSASVTAGDFPGSFKLPGPNGASIAIGGMIKAVAIHDSNAETLGPAFTVAQLGFNRPGRDDRDGSMSLDGTLSRMFVDGRIKVGDSQLRGYLEYDFNNGNSGAMSVQLRHAYGTWTLPEGTLLVGHTWSSFMDLAILPEGLMEPTVSGVIFSRQAQMRWTQAFAENFKYLVALEDPSSSDINDITNVSVGSKGKTALPDFVMGFDYDPSKRAHVGLRGMVRQLKYDTPGAGGDSRTAWGVSLTGRTSFLEKDRVQYSAVYGKGLGRYLLGIQAGAGSVLDPVDNSIDLRTNYGGMVSYQHYWTEALRSTAMVGYARSKPLGGQPANTFESSRYFSINLMQKVRPSITVGIEYAYGKNDYTSGLGYDNHRIGVGLQFF